MLSPGTIGATVAAAGVWWPVDNADPIAGAYLAGAAVTMTAVLAVRDARRARLPRRPATRDEIGGPR